MKDLKPYMVCSRTAGAAEGAILVFAHTVKEARKIGWKTGWLKDLCDGEWIDLQAYKINSEPWIMKQAKSEEPHSIEIPETCHDCLMWGFELDEKGLCESCSEDVK